jgi:hypothetical protein
MVCEHLRELEEQIVASGITETYRGKAWTENCREWVYFDCYLVADAIRQQFALPSCVTNHANHDARSGREAGLVCEECNDAIMGLHPSDAVGKPRFPLAG